MSTHTSSSSAIQWHRLLGTLLERFLTPVGIDVSTNVEVMSSPPEADILLLRRQGWQWSEEQKARLPDGIRDSDAKHILIEFKYTQSLNEQALRQAVGYDYFYQASRDLARHDLQTVVVSARTPRSSTLEFLGYELADHAGVYRSRTVLVRNVLLLVANELAETSHNASIKCFASRKPIKQRALNRLYKTRWTNTPAAFWWFLDGLLHFWFQRQGGEFMSHKQTITPEFITEMGKLAVSQILSALPPEELLKQVPYQELLKHLPPEERLEGVSHQDMLKQLSPEERLKDLKIADIERYLDRVKQQQSENEASPETDSQDRPPGSREDLS